MGRLCSHNGRSSEATGKPIVKLPLERSRRRLEANIRMNFQEIGVNTRNCVDSVQDSDYWIVNASLNLQVS